MNQKMNKDDNQFGVITRDMFGFSLFGRNKEELLTLISCDIEKKKKIWLVTVNPEFVMETKKDKLFLEILRSKTDYNVIDGVGVEWAIDTKLKIKNYELRIGRKIVFLKKIYFAFLSGLKILEGGGRENIITGADLMDDLCRVAESRKQSVYFLGGWDDRSKKTADYFIKKYPKLIVVGAQAEEFDFDKNIDYLFVAKGMVKQEFWIENNFDKLKVGLVMGVGRSFDYYSGELKRAPIWIRKIGFEWLFSLVMEPKRWQRQLALPKFIWMVLKN